MECPGVKIGKKSEKQQARSEKVGNILSLNPRAAQLPGKAETGGNFPKKFYHAGVTFGGRI